MAIGVGSNSLSGWGSGVGMGSMGGISSGVGTRSLPNVNTPNFLSNLGGAGGFDFSKLLQAMPSLLSALGIFGTAPSTDLDYKASLTPDTANSLIQSAGQRAYSTINRQSSLAKSNVGSQYYARGLGRSGAAIGDIAGIDMKAAGAVGDVQSDLAWQLAQMLAGIDQRNMQQAMFESQGKQSQWGDLADFGALLAQALPFIIGL